MRKGALWKEKLLEGLSWKKLIFILLGAAIATFGIHNIHKQVGITEGGVIGAMLLVEHWLGFSPAYITPVLDVACYLLAWKYLGGQFIKISILSTAGVSLFTSCGSSFLPCCRICPIPWRRLSWGACLWAWAWGSSSGRGGSSGGDDALALVISKVTKWRLSFAYLFTDLTVLALSLTYIPVTRIVFSVVTVTLSSFLIDQVQNLSLRRPQKA